MELTRQLGLLLALLCSTFAASAEMLIESPYVRAMPPGAPNSAAFMLISNQTDQPIALASAKSDVAERVEIHQSLMEDGVMKMRQLPSLTIPANGQIELKPGGFHIMLLGLKQPLTVGEPVLVKLFFDNGESVSVEADVRDIRAMHGAEHEEHHHHH